MLTAAAGMLLALASPCLAASRTHASAPGTNVNTVRTYGDIDYNNPPGGRSVGYGAYARGDAELPYQYAPSQNMPYGGQSSDGESYGGPNGW